MRPNLCSSLTLSFPLQFLSYAQWVLGPHPAQEAELLVSTFHVVPGNGERVGHTHTQREREREGEREILIQRKQIPRIDFIVCVWWLEFLTSAAANTVASRLFCCSVGHGCDLNSVLDVVCYDQMSRFLCLCHVFISYRS